MISSLNAGPENPLITQYTFCNWPSEMIFFCIFPDVFIAKDKYWMRLSKRLLCIKSFMARWIMFLSAPWPHLQKRFTNKFNRTSVLTECQSNSPLNCEVEVEEVPKAHALSQLIICN